MSKSGEKVSNEEQDGANTDSVYDFLYYDARRVGSFLAQFDQFGHLQNVTKGETASKGAKRGSHWKIGGSLPVPGFPEGAEASISGGLDPVQGGSESLALGYDPFWTNAISLLDYLSGQKLIKADLGGTGIGQFVIATGAISVFDLATVSKIWALPSLRNQINAQSPGGGNKRGKPSEFNTAVFALEMVSLMPHGIQVYMDSAKRTIWGSLRAEAMIVPPNDLFLKHGRIIAGQWTLVGILDAKPDTGAGMDGDPNLDVNILTHGFTSVLAALGPMARHLLGRPNHAFGVTPLLIFRKVGP
jgi:hypothetical protein